MTNKTYELGNKVTPKSGRWQQIICTICEIRTTGIETRYRLNDGNGDGVVWYTFDELDAYAPEPAPAAAPAPVNNAPEYLLGDNVTPTTGEWAGRLCWICDIRHTGVTPMYLIRDKHGKCDVWFGAEELTMVDDPTNYQKPTPTNPAYDSLKALADKQDEYIQVLEARVAELETAAQNAVDAYGKQDAEYTMRVLAHLVGIEWN